ncbi:CNNM domain-containing protein [Aurantiacibacter suaedae]|uniref:CNNM domain-containing protein n=1 Tax=Aurantiacibacter suaedae TaxID=2545755 RepID=UPI0010F4C6BD|nr:CNNM domain-containing protein [Aurantiacibacter suaedae]
MALLIFYVALALCVSFLCSLLESSLLTITPSQVQSASSRGARWASQMKTLKGDIDRPLAAILTLNTIAHTMGAAGAGAQYAKLYGDGSEAIFAGVLTLAILIVTEIIPKTIGARYAQQLAPFSAWILPAMITALGPLVWASRQITRLISFGRTPELPRHREELIALTSLGQASGQIDMAEMRFVQNMLQLHQLRNSDVMTPRTVVFSLPRSAAIADLGQTLRASAFSRIPVFDEERDSIVGFVIKQDILSRLADDDDSTEQVSDFLRTIPLVLDGSPVDRLFHRMIADHQHIVAVVDEYGSFLGLISLEDILETIFGFEIVDETDEVHDMQKLARQLSLRHSARAGRSG